jgi:hypothetical protein
MPAQIRDESSRAASKSAVRNIVVLAQDYFAAHHTYRGMTTAGLRDAPGNLVDWAKYAVSVRSGGASFYICAQAGTAWADQVGANGVLRVYQSRPARCPV